jgi:manganese-dependent ADP-ribose/CDP-alcohol diphosphatase
MLLLTAVTGVQAQNFNPCQDSVLFRIGLISDPQYCDCDPTSIRIYREVLQKLPAAIDSLNKYKVDFVMNLGDMIDRYYESFDSVSRLYESLTMPYYNLLGNHDFEEIPVALQTSILARYGMPDYYYPIIFKNWRFLVLDGTELAAYSRALHPQLAEEGDSLFQLIQDSINNRPWNGGIGRLQRAWIKEQIEIAYDERQQVVLFCHFPVFPDSNDLNLWNDDEIVGLIGKYPHVIAFINGHYHQGNYGFNNGIHYVTQAAMLDTYDNNSFSILEVFRDKLVMKGFGLNPDRTLPYSDPFKIPFSFTLSDSVLLSTHHAGSYIGKFTGNTGFEVTYFLGPDTGELKNSLFFISHDSLFLRNNMDFSGSGEVPILVTGITCIADTANIPFKLSYDAPIQSLPGIIDLPLFRIYPNPVDHVMYIVPENLSPYTLVTLTVVDLSGRLMEVGPPFLNPFTGITEVRFNADMRPGLYLVKLYLHPSGVVAEKIIVKGYTTGTY